MIRISVIVLFLASLFLHASAQLSTAKLFGNHMVLQRNQPVAVWGWNAKGARVTVDFNGQKISTKTDEEGNWKVILRPMEAGGPYEMTISSGTQQLVYNEIMMGEVWICSGQSNMEFQLKNAYGFKEEQKNAAHTTIRQFQVHDKISQQPEKDLSGGEWVKADTNTVGDFTAVGYFFAKKLAQNLHVTIGLISSNWGGTVAEDWISKDAMLASPELGPAAAALPANWDDLKIRLDKQLKQYAYRNQPVVNYTIDELAAQPVSFFANWQNGPAPGAWEWMGKLYSYRGEGFMQRLIKLDSGYAQSKSVLRLGTTDADIALYINGKLIKKGALASGYQFDLPAETWKGGYNSLLIELMSQQKNPAWFGMGINGVGNDINIQFADTTINMADNNWKTMPDLSKPYHFNFLPNNTASMLYNAMVNPLIPYSIAGVIWYQGESNADRAFQYRTTFPLLITNWRDKWKRDFPFIFVQLTSFGGMQNSNIGSQWAELREAQGFALQLPNTGIAVTTDVGDPFNLHPKNKDEVGFRLANNALTMTYHLTGFTESPLFKSADFNDNYALISFTGIESGLMAKDKYGYVKGFELAGADHKFYYAQAIIIADNKVKVWCNQVTQPVAVRYGWTDAPIDANLFTLDGIPVGPFRSDSWNGVTVGKKFE
ncbi:sialate O-acetylesterase [Mucilaginibacter sp. X4EP1]|uniref:sialate O-acetylesterase n=1 Tax=Mucilaginibacter sp. X4EP1 TaxID=2723092 RepID=UPI0021681983|nr:sialate O-acetylesterase [Mucilaginibacter sp. X4EP1]MCS3814971.1 sialate O-acetylesterase [Mucilaginibacter sp. X4EP1]